MNLNFWGWGLKLANDVCSHNHLIRKEKLFLVHPYVATDRILFLLLRSEKKLYRLRGWDLKWPISAPCSFANSQGEVPFAFWSSVSFSINDTKKYHNCEGSYNSYPLYLKDQMRKWTWKYFENEKYTVLLSTVILYMKALQFNIPS